MSDVEKLNCAIKNKFPNLRIKVVNDIWLAFASEIHEGWDAVSICGTGHNAAVMMPDGKMFSIWALKDTLGNWGGDRQLTDQAMHRAFRSYQETGVYTRLEEQLPELCDVSDMNELASTIYNSVYEYQYQYPVPSLVFQLASEGDAVCHQLIRSMGLEIGEILDGLLRKAQLSAKTVPVALGGALFCGENNQLLIDCFREGLSDTAPAFDFRILKNPPVMGALILALNDIGIPSDDCLVSVLSDNTVRLFSQVKDGGD